MSSIRDNIERVWERMERACAGSGRKRDAVRLMAVTKTVDVDAVMEAAEAGLTLFGENRVQDAREKIPQLPESLEWHMIGHLQRNKVKYVLRLFKMIQSVDSLRLLKEIDKRAGRMEMTVPVLIEVNLADEASKSGVAEPGFRELIEMASAMEHVAVKGLMTVPPFLEDAEEVRPYFQRLRELSEKCASWKLPGVSMQELSMGMTHDFEQAIEEGATIVRVGTAIFGSRDQR